MYTIITAILSILLLFGGIHPSTDHPMTVRDPDNLRMTFVAVSDTHVCNTAYSQTFTSLIFEDAAHAAQPFDTCVICGDLADNGANGEYNRLFSVLQNQSAIPNPIIALGNHDARFALSENASWFRGAVETLTGVDTQGKNYYTCQVNGYTFIVLGTEKQLQLQAYISEEQLQFLDSALATATADGKPAFVVCHQPLQGVNGADAVWGVGDQSSQIRSILCKYQNVFFLSGHLHDGFNARSMEKISDAVWCLNLPAYGKAQDVNNLSRIRQKGVGYYAEVYDDAVIFTGRNFRKGNDLDVVYRCELVSPDPGPETELEPETEIELETEPGTESVTEIVTETGPEAVTEIPALDDVPLTEPALEP